MVKEKAVLAADIGGSKLLCALVTEDARIIDKERRELNKNITAQELEAKILSCYTALKERNCGIDVWACGATVPGVADPKTGTWIYACFSGIRDYPVAKRLSDILALPVYVENDANANAIGEMVFGCCKDTSDFLWVTVSNGVGGGLVLDGRIYTGKAFGGGEIGHLVVEYENALPCPCGHLGCLEAMAAGPAISRRYKSLSGTDKTAKEIFELAKGNDRYAQKVVDDTATYIGRALGKTASLMNLEKYVLGGGVMQSFDQLKDKINEAFKKEAFAEPNKNAVITRTALGYDAGIYGAAALAFINKNKEITYI